MESIVYNEVNLNEILQFIFPTKLNSIFLATHSHAHFPPTTLNMEEKDKQIH